MEDDEDKKTSPLSASATPNHIYNSMQSGGTNEAHIPPGNTPADKSIAAKAWSGFDAKYMKPLLTHSNPTLMETLPNCCGTKLGRILTSNEQLSKHPRMITTHSSTDEEPQPPNMFNNDSINVIDDGEETITIEHR